MFLFFLHDTFAKLTIIMDNCRVENLENGPFFRRWGGKNPPYNSRERKGSLANVEQGEHFLSPWIRRLECSDFISLLKKFFFEN